MTHRKAPPGTCKVRDHKGTYRTIELDHLLVAARDASIARFADNPIISCPADTTRYLEAAIGSLEHEVFCALWLDTRHRVLRFDELFRGTIDAASVWPREVVKAGLGINAAAAVICHNHPSANAEPSASDRTLTQRLREALELFDIALLDHIVIGDPSVSFAERGWL